MGAQFTRPIVARGAAYADFDRDGDLDVLITTNHGPAYLFRNDGGNRNNWLAVRTRGAKSNRDGIGAVVRVESASGKQWNMVRSGSSYCSQSDLALTFGLGARQRGVVDRSGVAERNQRQGHLCCRGQADYDRGRQGDCPDDRREESEVSSRVSRVVRLALLVPAAAWQVGAQAPMPSQDMEHPQGTNAGIYAFTGHCASCHDARTNGAPDQVRAQPAHARRSPGVDDNRLDGAICERADRLREARGRRVRGRTAAGIGGDR